MKMEANNEFHGLDVQTLRDLLENSKNFPERRRIRAALREAVGRNAYESADGLSSRVSSNPSNGDDSIKHFVTSFHIHISNGGTGGGSSWTNHDNNNNIACHTRSIAGRSLSLSSSEEVRNPISNHNSNSSYNRTYGRSLSLPPSNEARYLFSNHDSSNNQGITNGKSLSSLQSTVPKANHNDILSNNSTYQRQASQSNNSLETSNSTEVNDSSNKKSSTTQREDLHSTNNSCDNCVTTPVETYKTSFHRDINRNYNTEPTVTMAAATSPARALSSSELAPDKMSTRRSSATLDSYRALRRTSRTMLSDGGLLLSSAASPASPTSPLFQIATDINNSLVTTRDTSASRRLSDSGTFLRPSLDKPSYRRLSTRTELPSTILESTSFSPTPARRWSSALQTPTTSVDANAQASTTTSSDSVFSTEISSMPSGTDSLPKSKANERRFSYSAASTSNPDSPVSFSRQNFGTSHKETVAGGEAETNIGIYHASPVKFSSSVADVGTRNGAAPKRENKKSSTGSLEAFGTIREKGRQMSESIVTRPLASPLNDYSKTTKSNYENAEVRTDQGLSVDRKDKQESAGHDPIHHSQPASVATSQPRTKSKFLTDLYSSGEKIQKFINREKHKPEASNDLSTRVSDLQQQTSALVNSDVKRLDFPVNSEGSYVKRDKAGGADANIVTKTDDTVSGAAVKTATEPKSNSSSSNIKADLNISSPRSSKTSFLGQDTQGNQELAVSNSENFQRKTLQASNTVACSSSTQGGDNVSNSIIGTISKQSISKEERELDTTHVQTDSTQVNSRSLGASNSQSVTSAAKDETFKLNKDSTSISSVLKEETPRQDGIERQFSLLQRLSETGDNDVFSPGVPDTGNTTQTLIGIRRHSSFDVFDFSNLGSTSKLSPNPKSASTLSVDSQASTPRFPLPKVALTPSGPVSLRKRLSLPDTSALIKDQVRDALKSASEIHEKYTTGLFSPLERHPSMIRHSQFHRFKSGEIVISPLQSPAVQSANTDAIKTREITSRSPLGLTVISPNNQQQQPAVSTNVITIPRPTDKSQKPPLKSYSFTFDLSKPKTREQPDGDSARSQTPQIVQKEITVHPVSSTSTDSSDSAGTSTMARKTRIVSESDRGEHGPLRRASVPASGTSSSHKVVLGQDGKSYHYIDSCESEAELSKMLSGSEDYNERRRIRARMRDLKARQQGKGGDKGLLKSFDSSSPRKTSIGHSPVIGAGRSGSGGGSTGSEGGDADREENEYEGITSISELQRLLIESTDTGERRKIRNVIRKLKTSSETEQLKNARPGKPDPQTFTLGRHGRSGPDSSTTPSDNADDTTPQLSTSSSLFTSKKESILHSSLKDTDTKDSKSEIIIRRPSSPSVALTDVNNIFNRRPSLDNGFLQKPAPIISVTPQDAASAESFDKKTLKSLNSSNQSQFITGEPKYTQSVVISGKAEDDSSSARDNDEVSSVLQQVKARLQSRSESTSADRKSPNYLTSSDKDTKSQLTPDSAFKSESGSSVFLFPGETSQSRSSNSERPSSRSSERSSDSGSNRYREARQQILGTVDLAINREKLAQSTSSAAKSKTKDTQSEVSKGGSDQTSLSGFHVTPELSWGTSGADSNRGREPSSPSKIPVLKSRKDSLKSSQQEVSDDTRLTLKDRSESLDGSSFKGFQSEGQRDSDGTKSVGGDKPHVYRRGFGSVKAINTAGRNWRDQKTESGVSSSSDKLASSEGRTTGELSFTKRDDKPLTDFELLEKGQKPSNSKTLVSSLAAKFSRLDIDDTDRQSAPLRRTQSLHSKVRNPLPSEKKDVKFVVIGTSKPASSGTPRVVDVNTKTAVRSTESEEHKPQIIQPRHVIRRSSVPVDEAKKDYLKNSSKSAYISVERPTDITDSGLKSPVNAQTSAGEETIELPQKSTLRRSRPVTRSLTESTVTRPEKYKRQMQDQQLANRSEQTTSNTDLSKDARQRKSGVTLCPDPASSDKSTSLRSAEVVARSVAAPDHKGFKVERKASDKNRDEYLESRQVPNVGDIGKGKPPAGIVLPRPKRVSVPAFGSTSQIDKKSSPTRNTNDSASSNLPQRRHSNIYSREPASSMEQAFNMLLEDLDKVSGSEGNPSDLELSDGEDLLAPGGGSDHSQGEPVSEDKLANGHRNKEKDGVLNTGEEHKDSETILKSDSEGLVDKVSFQPSDRHKKDATFSSSVDEVDSRSATDTKGVDVREADASRSDSWIRQDSISGKGVDDTLLEKPQKDELKGQRTFSSSSLSSPSSASSPLSPATQQTGENTQRTSSQLDEPKLSSKPDMTGEKTEIIASTTTTKPSTMDNSNDDNILDNDNNNTTHITTTKLELSPQPQPIAPFTRTFNINEDEDGSVTMQAIAEDQNQNRVVTVRTKKQRTPSNADEEMRDTIVEKKMFSPSGSVLEERDVIQTKKRLTSRGSNYYTRSAYTTRTRRDKEGAETIEHNVCVESENRSVSQGQSWGDKAVTRVTLEDASNANVLISSVSPLAIEDQSKPEVSADKDNQQNGVKTEEGKSSVSGLLTVTGRMDMSKASSGYGSVSGSEEDDAHKEDGTSNTTPAHEGPPEIVQALKDVTMTEGRQIVLECGLMSTQTPTIVWFKDDDEVSDTDSYPCRFDADTGKASLTITDATIFDTALYCCLCQNDAGVAKTQCRVVVKRRPEHPPVFEKGLSDVTVTEGHSTILSCIISEAASVAWYKDGIVQRNSSDFKQTFDGREARLEIGEVFLDDVGNYACVAKNEAGEQRSSCKLDVNACGSETTVVPMFLTKLPNRVVNDGEALSLECDVIGSPEPNISWMKDGEKLDDGLSFSTSYDGRVASLHISKMSIEDAGCYMCVAENPAGKVSMDANVTVQVKNKAPHFISKMEDVSTTSGKSIILRCEISGTPKPNVLWRKDGLLVGASHNFLQSYNNGVARLEILGAGTQDGGHYECVAKNSVSEISCACQVEVADPKAKPQETTAPKEEQVAAPLPKVTTRRTFKKLSEPRPADIISAVLQRASSHGVQRAQSFSPNSTSFSQDSFRPAPIREGISTGSGEANSGSKEPSDTVMPHAPQRPETLRVIRDSITVSPRSVSSTISTSSEASDSSSPRDIDSVPVSARSEDGSVTSRSIASPRLTNLGRSSSMHIVRNNNLLSPTSDTGRSPSPSTIKPVWTPPSQEEQASESRETITKPARETITRAGSLETVGELRPSSPIPGYRPVSPMFLNSPDREKRPASPLTRSASSASSSGRDYSARSADTDHVLKKNDEKGEPFAEILSSSPSSLSSSLHSSTSNLNGTKNIPETSSQSSAISSPASSLPSSASSSSQRVNEEVSPRQPHGLVQSPRVSQLRLQFLKNDQSAAADQQARPSGGGGGVRRWHSLPPQESRPNVVKREKSALAAPSFPSMPSYDHINDEEELHKLMNATEDFEERKKIRARLREIRDKQRDEWEAKRKQREAEAEDLVKKKFEKAEEEKRKKMEAYKHQAPTHERDSKYHEVTQNLIKDKYKTAEEEKAKRMEAYSHIAEKTGPGGSKTTTTTTTSVSQEKTPGGGTRTVTQKVTETSTKGFGGTAYGKPAAKPQGAKGAMAAFKQMDSTNNPNAAAKPKAMVRSPSAIKQVLLDWTKAMTRGYSNVEITNFSSSWNNGMAFCALIHHFFPNAFDFDKLDPKQRRYNFTLAFDTAEKEADIAPLLDVDDMVKMKNPDWKCVFTYVQSLYRHLKDHENNKAGPIEQ